MPGVVKKIQCEVKDSVAEETLIVTLEAMKMQNPIFAPMTGKVSRFSVRSMVKGKLGGGGGGANMQVTDMCANLPNTIVMYLPGERGQVCYKAHCPCLLYKTLRSQKT